MQRRVFDPGTVPLSFWRQPAIQQALAGRAIGTLLRYFLAEFPNCTQTQLALLTSHDRSDISNFVRGIRVGQVSDIEVLTRIADGLHIPDEARVLLGLAPASLPTSMFRDVPRPQPSNLHSPNDHITGWLGPQSTHPECSIAVCGSHTAKTDPAAITEIVRSLGSLFAYHRFQVIHGPVGIGIELMTYIADHYRPPGLTSLTARLGHANVIRDAQFVIVIGGGEGTRDEVDLALAMGKKVLPIPCTGGTAQHTYTRMCTNVRLHSWLDSTDLIALADAEQCATIVHRLTTTAPGDPHD